MNRHPWRRKLPAIAGGAFLLLFTVAVVWKVVDYVQNAENAQKPHIQQISLVTPPPPKEPPKPPEPEKLEKPKEEVKMDDPKPEPQSATEPPPPGGIQDGPVGGMQTDLGRGTGIGIGGNGDRQSWYGRLISRHLEDALRRDKRLQGKDYQVTVLLWFDATGDISQIRLSRGSGRVDTDELLKQVLQSVPPLREALPGDLMQPVRIRVASRA